MLQPEAELLPARARFTPDTAIEIEVRGPVREGRVLVDHLGEVVLDEFYDGSGHIRIDGLAAGGYGVRLITSTGQELRTALAVSGKPRARLRYGFVASYTPGRDVTGVADNVRRLHLDAVQFYDWAYRHADLMGGGETYHDALNQPISLETVRTLIAALHAAGADALGYAAVYAAGPDEWPDWQHEALLDAGGKPFSLGDFLFILDPAAPDWLRHFGGELIRAAALGFDGFHLDQYGYPRRAVRADGAVVDVADSFVTMIRAIRDALPDARLVFNNVNDFPTDLTAHTDQDAIYIEPWEPQTGLQDLADTATRARGRGGNKPVVMAAYQQVYDEADERSADTATALTMATLYSHGATQLLAGEDDRVLCDPYYVRNHAAGPSTRDLLKRWYDFLVAHDELLMPAEIIDVTNSYAGIYNDELDVTFGGTQVAHRATPGSVWRRIMRVGDRLVMHLINLVNQTDTLWDAPRIRPTGLAGGQVSMRPLRNRLPRAAIADPDKDGRLHPLKVRIAGDKAVADLPPLNIWQMVVIDL